jgi:hypothetical protein
MCTEHSQPGTQKRHVLNIHDIMHLLELSQQAAKTISPNISPDPSPDSLSIHATPSLGNSEDNNPLGEILPAMDYHHGVLMHSHPQAVQTTIVLSMKSYIHLLLP